MSPLDFYHKFMWKFTPNQKQERDGFYGCTKCGLLIQNYDEVQRHCHNQDCENQESIGWLNELKP